MLPPVPERMGTAQLIIYNTYVIYIPSEAYKLYLHFPSQSMLVYLH